MIIHVLTIDQTSISGYDCEHGLSLCCEVNDRTFMFDVGATGLFASNAKKMNIDLKKVEFLILSHGHYDHGGGLSTFFKINDHAEVLIHHLAFQPLYSQRGEELHSIGLDPQFKHHSSVILTGKRFFIDAGIQLFASPPHLYPLPIANQSLKWNYHGKIEDDPFLHEQSCLIQEDDQLILLAGCAHQGILNIIEYVKSLKGKYPDVVVGGFHLSGRMHQESTDTIDAIADVLLKSNAIYYTGHCTGEEPYRQLKKRMGDHLHRLETGLTINL